MEVLVTGATGFVGSRLVAALSDHEVTVLVRDPDRYEAPENVTVIGGNALDPDLDLPSVDALFYLIHSMETDSDFEKRDRQAAENVREAAEAASIDRIIYLSGLGDETDELSRHLRSRREVERILAGGTPTLTTLRAAIIIGEGSMSFQVIRQLAARLPVMITPQWVRTECQPIYIDDVIAYLVGVLEAPETAGKTFEIGGPNVYTYEEILTRTAEQIGRRRPIIVPVPVLSPRISARWLRLVTDVPSAVARPLVEGLRNRVVVTDRSVDGYVRVELTPFDTAVRLTLEAIKGDRE